MNYTFISIVFILSTFLFIKKYILDNSNMDTLTRPKVTLPAKLKIGYANWGECDDKIFEAVQNGLNVIIWFSVDLTSKDGKPNISRGPDYTCVAKMVKRFKDNNYQVINLLSIGGWNSPHPDTTHSAAEYFTEWVNFNQRISNPSLSFYGFDGFDWDIEGNDDFASPSNHFTLKELDLMAELSVLAKQKGYIVAMAPAESYVDVTTSEFSLSLMHNHKEWEEEVPNFTYHGRNAYAYLIAKVGIDNFDFVSVQLYEGYTHTLYRYERKKENFGLILKDLVTKLDEGYEVDFSSVDSEMGKNVIRVPKEKIVIGLANAWATKQFLFVKEEDIVSGYKELEKEQKECRGFMFWDIADEGKVHEGESFYMAKVLNKIFH